MRRITGKVRLRTFSPDSPRFRRNGERILLPHRVYILDVALHIGAGQAFPMSIIDFLQRWLGCLLETMRARQNPRRQDNTAKRAGVVRVKLLVFQALGKTDDLSTPLAGQIDIGGAGEAVYFAKRGGPL